PPHPNPPPQGRAIAYVHDDPCSHCLRPLAPRRGERVGVRGAARSAPFHWRFVVLRDPLTPTLSPLPGARGKAATHSPPRQNPICRRPAPQGGRAERFFSSRPLDGGGLGWGWDAGLDAAKAPRRSPYRARKSRGGAASLARDWPALQGT